jgi:hypothetical protein
MNIHTGTDELIIDFKGFEQILVLKSRLVIKRSEIVTIKWHQLIKLRRRELGWRIDGTDIPKVILAGRFAGLSGVNFVYLRHPHNIMALKSARLNHVLEIETREYRYKKLLLSLNDPELAIRLIEWSRGKVA